MMGATRRDGGRAHRAIEEKNILPDRDSAVKSSTQSTRVGTLLAATIGVCGCGDLLTVSDPNQITSDELDSQLPLVANGVEGSFHQEIDVWVVYQALLADVYQSTDTSSTLKNIDLGRVSGLESGWIGNAWTRTLGAARDAEERFVRVLGEAGAASSPFTAQVRLTVGLAELYLGMTFCEWQTVPIDAIVSDRQLLLQAERTLTDAIGVARLAQRPEYETAARAARAQAHLLLEHWGGAESDASAIPAGFSYDAAFPQDANRVVRLSNRDHRRAAGLMYKWWPLIEAGDEPGHMMDPWTGRPDPRIPVFHAGEVGDDMETPYYSQWKYKALDDGIPLVHFDLMRLIVAEARARVGDYAGATGILNELRASVGLSAHAIPSTGEAMAELVLWERFAELFMEGQRLVDLHRFGLMRGVFEALQDPARPGEGRPSKWGSGC